MTDTRLDAAYCVGREPELELMRELLHGAALGTVLRRFGWGNRASERAGCCASAQQSRPLRHASWHDAATGHRSVSMRGR